MITRRRIVWFAVTVLAILFLLLFTGLIGGQGSAAVFDAPPGFVNPDDPDLVNGQGEGSDDDSADPVDLPAAPEPTAPQPQADPVEPVAEPTAPQVQKAVERAVAPEPQPKPCRNLPDPVIPSGFVRDSTGTCFLLPESDLALTAKLTITGSTATWVMTVWNGEGDMATSILLQDELHDGLGPTHQGEQLPVTVTSSQGSCHYDQWQERVICDLGTLFPRGLLTVTVSALVRGNGYHIAYVNSNQNDHNMGDNAIRQEVIHS